MPTTLFAACLARLGLSQSEAEQVLGIKLQRIKDMSVGRARVPDGVWAELRAYEDQIGERADALAAVLDEASEKAGSQPDYLDAVVDDGIGLMALADVVLTNDVTPGNVQVAILT